MTHADRSDPRPTRRLRGWLLVPLVPMVVLGVVAFANGAPASATVAPLLGPFAGVPLGHWDCTMANQSPLLSAGAGALGLFAVAAHARGRRSRTLSILGSVAWVTFCVAWILLAGVSQINATS